MMNFPPLCLKNLTIRPPLFLAPMAGITHSAFRRLVSDFGGHGALFTEMLSGKALLHEKIGATPFTIKRLQEGVVWYQLALSGDEDIPRIIDKLNMVGPAALDVNAACPAPEVLPRGFGASLFRDAARLERVLRTVRGHWEGALTMKCRIGDDNEKWRETFSDRMKLCVDIGVDAVFVHPRFFNEKLKHRARWELFEWICEQTSLPVIASGDIDGAEAISARGTLFAKVCGIMIGRIAVVKPWLFRDFGNPPLPVDYAAVWNTFYGYVLEDFPPEKAIGRIKEFTRYFAQNFLFGHELASRVQSAQSLEILHERAVGFLSSNPAVTKKPSVAGL
jgi:tRNA-dihydrouridine synthase B